MGVHYNEEGFKGPSLASQLFLNIDEAKKILSFVGVNPKAKEFFPQDSSQMKKNVYAYIMMINGTDMQKIAEKEAEDCHCRKRILSVALKNLCGNCKNCKKSFQETCVRLINWDFSCPHDFARKTEEESCHEFLLTVLLQNCLEDHLRGPNCLTYSNTTYSSSYEDNMAISGNDDTYWVEEVAHQSTEEEFYEEESYEEESYEEKSYDEESYEEESYEEETYNPYSGVENLTQEFSGVSRSSEIVYYEVEWNPYNLTYFNIKQD